LVIERVVVEITAKKLGNTGYISFAVDNPGEDEHYFMPSISISSNSFQRYSQVWDMNPVSGEKWTYDSLNSLIAGFKYDGGQSGVQISELQLTISYYLPEPIAELAPQQAPEPMPPSDEQDTAEENSDGGANQNGQEDAENGSDGVQESSSNQPQGEEQNDEEGPATTDTTR
jgi:hypothetical protein